MYANAFATIGAVVLQYLLYVLVGHYAIKWNNKWKAGFVPYIISLIIFVIVVVVSFVFNLGSNVNS